MVALEYVNILFIMAVILFGLGFFTCLAGVIVLISKTMMGKNMQTLAKQTTLLAQKGITDDVAGLVGNASVLMSSLEQMVKTTTGIGLFLIMIGIGLMGAAYFIFSQYAQLT